MPVAQRFGSGVPALGMLQLQVDTALDAAMPKPPRTHAATIEERPWMREAARGS
jgi:hypothetical protein